MRRGATVKMAPAFRALELATDVRHMADFFGAHLERLGVKRGIAWELYVPRVFARGTSGFVIQYVIASRHRQGETQTNIFCGYLPDAEARSQLQVEKDAVLVHERLGLIVPVFPYDPELANLADWYNPNGCTAGIRRLLDNDQIHVAQVAVLAYRLSRRCTLRCMVHESGSSGEPETSDHIIVKLLRPKDAARAQAAHKRLAEVRWRANDSGKPAIPALMASDPAAGVLATECVPGFSLHDLWHGSDGVRACTGAGNVLADLHMQSPSGELRTAAQELSNLHTRVERLCTIFPQVASECREAVKRLETDLPEQPADLTAIHGDFYDKQVYFSPQRTTLLDFDMIGAGDPALDIGNFRAHALLRALQHPERADSIAGGEAAFVRAYGKSHPDRMIRAHWWHQAALVRLATLYALRPRWRDLAGTLLRKAVGKSPEPAANAG